jgi:hypothetical protein
MRTAARSICVAVLALVALAGTGPAGHAKGPTEVDAYGPGVDVHLTYTERTSDVDAGTLGDASRIYDIWSREVMGPAPDLSADELGPRYVLTWSGAVHGDERDVVVQHAYPFAEGGAWVEFLPAQELYGAPVAEGWVEAPRLRADLVALGAAADAPHPARTEPGHSADPVADASERASSDQDDSSAYRIAVPAGVLLASVVLIGLLAARRLALSR